MSRTSHLSSTCWCQCCRWFRRHQDGAQCIAAVAVIIFDVIIAEKDGMDDAGDANGTGDPEVLTFSTSVRHQRSTLVDELVEHTNWTTQCDCHFCWIRIPNVKNLNVSLSLSAWRFWWSRDSNFYAVRVKWIRKFISVQGSCTARRKLQCSCGKKTKQELCYCFSVDAMTSSAEFDVWHACHVSGP